MSRGQRGRNDNMERIGVWSGEWRTCVNGNAGAMERRFGG
jgi:hypothetical protein